MPRKKEERVRMMVSFDPDVLDVFRELARASRVSLGRCIGDWCGDTVDGALFVTAKMVEAQGAPKMVMKELHASAAGVLKHLQKSYRGRA